jgi:hypothetical protein
MAGNYDVGISIKALDEFSETFKTLQKQLTSMQKGFEKASHSLDKFSEKFKTIGRKLSISLTAPIAGAGAYIYKQVNDFDDINKKLILATGSAAKAQEVFSGLREVFKETDIPMRELSTSAMGLMSLGLSTEKAMAKLKMMVSVAEGAEGSFGDVSYAIIRAETIARRTQASNKGLLLIDAKSAMTLKNLIPALIPTLSSMAGLTKYTGKQIADSFVQGGVSVSFFEEALKRVSAREAADSMEESITKIHHILQLFAYDLGESVTGTTDAKNAVEALRQKLSGLEHKFLAFAKANPEIIKMVAAFAGALAIIGPMAILIGMMANPVSLVAAGIMGAGLWMVYLYNHSKSFHDTVNKIKDTFNENLQILKDTYHWFGKCYDKAKKWIGEALKMPGITDKQTSVATSKQTSVATSGFASASAATKNFSSMDWWLNQGNMNEAVQGGGNPLFGQEALLKSILTQGKQVVDVMINVNDKSWTVGSVDVKQKTSLNKGKNNSLSR